MQRNVPHILVVDGRAADALIARHCLEQLGCTFDIAANCAEAADRFGKKPFDYILIDLATLGDDREFMDLVRHHERSHGNGRTKVIAMSVITFVDDLKSCAELGVDGYLPKPCSPDALARKLGLQDPGGS